MLHNFRLKDNGFLRDALIATYPNVKTLMCYFHVVNCCKKNLRSLPAATQKQSCDDVYHLHCSISQVELENRYREVARRWRFDFPDLLGTSTHNGFWVTSLIGKFIAVNQGLQIQTMLLNHLTT
jgi:hypothetical protein